MSEEKPTFKVTDRRLFNPDGTPREGVERAEEATPAADEAPPPQAAAAADAESQPDAAAGETEAAAGGGREASAETSQEFLMLTEFVASFAADAMGMVTHPGGQPQPDVNLPLARQCIDMLGALRQKTSGNLSAEERRFIDSILSQLRMQYVSLTSAPRGPQPERGFSGGDITGGR